MNSGDKLWERTLGSNFGDKLHGKILGISLGTLIFQYFHPHLNGPSNKKFTLLVFIFLQIVYVLSVSIAEVVT